MKADIHRTQDGAYYMSCYDYDTEECWAASSLRGAMQWCDETAHAFDCDVKNRPLFEKKADRHWTVEYPSKEN